MTRRQARRRRRGSSRVGRWAVGVTIALAMIATGAVVLAGNQSTPNPALTVAARGRTMGFATAPVVVEEWGDFQ